jgi:hypothetical protein
MMKVVIAALMILLAAPLRPVLAAEPAAADSAALLVEAMRQGKLSDGFEARMSVATVLPNGRRLPNCKLAVIGQFGVESERLLIRGISPDKVRDLFFAAERRADGEIRSMAFAGNAAARGAQTDPFANVLQSGLTMWDMLSPWWNWQKQELGGTERIAGSDCSIVRSQADSAAAAIREVVSCVDRDAGLSLRTQLFDGRHALIRTIFVVQTVRRESGATAARRLLITGAGNTTTEIDLYSGDEHYRVPADTFVPLDARP